MSLRDRQIAIIYRLIEKIWGTGALLAFHDLIEEYERKESSKDK